MQDFNFDSLERGKEASRRIKRILENRSNRISNDMYDIEEDNNSITRINELLLEGYEGLQKLPTEVSQFTEELNEKYRQTYEANIKERQQIYEANFKAMRDESDKLIEISSEIRKEINSTNKTNRRLTILCGLLLGLLIASVITIIILKT